MLLPVSCTKQIRLRLRPAEWKSSRLACVRVSDDWQIFMARIASFCSVAKNLVHAWIMLLDMMPCGMFVSVCTALFRDTHVVLAVHRCKGLLVVLGFPLPGCKYFHTIYTYEIMDQVVRIVSYTCLSVDYVHIYI